jgi:hypothetical protein
VISKTAGQLVEILLIGCLPPTLVQLQARLTGMQRRGDAHGDVLAGERFNPDETPVKIVSAILRPSKG